MSRYRIDRLCSWRTAAKASLLCRSHFAHVSDFVYNLESNVHDFQFITISYTKILKTFATRIVFAAIIHQNAFAVTRPPVLLVGWAGRLRGLEEWGHPHTPPLGALASPPLAFKRLIKDVCAKNKHKTHDGDYVRAHAGTWLHASLHLPPIEYYWNQWLQLPVSYRLILSLATHYSAYFVMYYAIRHRLYIRAL